jgi:hypothetical protein
MKKIIWLVIFLSLLNCYGIGKAEDICELAAAMEEDGVRGTIQKYKGRGIAGQGLLNDVEPSGLNPVTYYIHTRCDLKKIANFMVYVEANYNRMRKVGSMVSFNGRLESSTGWGEFVGSHEPYIQLTLRNGRISWAD